MSLKVDRQIVCVEIPAHDVVHEPSGRRWNVPARMVEIGGTPRYALERAVVWATSDAGVPPLRSLLRQTALAATVTRTSVEVLVR